MATGVVLLNICTKSTAQVDCAVETRDRWVVLFVASFFVYWKERVPG